MDLVDSTTAAVLLSGRGDELLVFHLKMTPLVHTNKHW